MGPTPPIHPFIAALIARLAHRPTFSLPPQRPYQPQISPVALAVAHALLSQQPHFNNPGGFGGFQPPAQQPVNPCLAAAFNALAAGRGPVDIGGDTRNPNGGLYLGPPAQQPNVHPMVPSGPLVGHWPSAPPQGPLVGRLIGPGPAHYGPGPIRY